MKNQHQLIKGYRDLTAEEIALMNEIKRHAEEVGALCEKLKTIQYRTGTADNGKVDGRWLAIGQTHLQEGFMALARSVANPRRSDGEITIVVARTAEHLR